MGVLRRTCEDVDADQDIEEDDDVDLVSFELKTTGQNGTYTFTFENVQAADSFERDFRVRQKLMDVALLTMKKQHAAEEACSQIKKFERQNWFQAIWHRT